MGCCASKDVPADEPDSKIELRANGGMDTPTGTDSINLQMPASEANGSCKKETTEESQGDVVTELHAPKKSMDQPGGTLADLKASTSSRSSSEKVGSSLGDTPGRSSTPRQRNPSFVSDVGSHSAGLTKSLSIVHNESSIGVMEALYDLSNATVIGRGGNGSVSIITKRGTDQKFALKTVKTEELTTKLRAELQHEIDVQKSLDHPNIVRVYESFEDLVCNEVRATQRGPGGEGR